MTNSARFGFPPPPQTAPRVEHGQGERYELSLESAMRWAHEAGKGLGVARRWVEVQAIGNRPLTTLGIVFGLGVFTGWLVKRR